MTHTSHHATARARLLALLALVAGVLALTAFALPAPPASAAVSSTVTANLSCGATTWTAGTYYNVGAIVQYPSNGDYYIATNANPGYDPTISTWYWSPYSCAGSSEPRHPICRLNVIEDFVPVEIPSSFTLFIQKRKRKKKKNLL